MMYYICVMDQYLSDDEIRRRIAARKRRKTAVRRTAAFCIAAVIAVTAGYLVGNAVGGASVRTPEIKSIAEDIPLVSTGMEQIGNKGGKKFWSWYGYGGHVSWCACFASWCEDQCGYLDSGDAPRFATVTDGIDWFKARGQWLDADASPSAGDLIFFDWEDDGYRDHVGIVTGVVGDKVFTVEGNSSDRCRVKRYTIGDVCIEGYGHIEVSSGGSGEDA